MNFKVLLLAKKVFHSGMLLLSMITLLGSSKQFLLIMCCCLVIESCLTLLQPRGRQPTRLHCPQDFPGKKTGVDCHFLLQGIFLSQGLNLCLLQWQADSLLLSHQGCPLIMYLCTLKKGFPRGSPSTGAHWRPLCGLLIRKTYLPTDPAEKWWKGTLYFLVPLIHQSIGLAKKFTWVSVTFYGKT